MLNWWLRPSKIRQKKTEASIPPPPPESQFGTAPGTEIRYDPALPNRLADEHRVIMGLIDTITETENGGDYRLITAQIGRLSITVRQHFVMENIQFYTYLDRLYANHAEFSPLIKETRREANTASRMVSGFLSDYRDGDWDHSRKCRLRKDLHLLRRGLRKRIHTEENDLSLLYVEPGRF